MPCEHRSTLRIGEIGGRFGDEWCRECGALKSWDNYIGSRERSPWIPPLCAQALATAAATAPRPLRCMGTDLPCDAIVEVFGARCQRCIDCLTPREAP